MQMATQHIPYFFESILCLLDVKHAVIIWPKEYLRLKWTGSDKYFKYILYINYKVNFYP